MITEDYTLVPNINWNQLATARIVLECDTTTEAINISLPKISTVPGRIVMIVVVDATGAATTSKPITITPWSDVDESDTINGLDSDQPVYIVSAGGSITLSIGSDTEWVAIQSNAQPADNALKRTFIANATQTSSSAPTVVILESSTGNPSIVFARTSAGVYTATSTGAFAGTVGLQIASSSAANTYGIVKTNANTLTITTSTGGTPTDGLLTSTRMQIDFYPE